MAPCAPACREICAALAECRFETRAVADVMRAKHAKLLLNLANAAGALCGAGSEQDELVALARAEGDGDQVVDESPKGLPRPGGRQASLR